MPRRVAILIAIILFTLGGIWWRWIWLPPADLDLVQVHIDLPQQEHPLDELLRDYVAHIGSSVSLLEQLRRQPETFAMRNLLVDACEVSQGQFRRFAHWRAAQVNPPLAHLSTPPDWEFKSQSQDHRLLGQLEVSAGGLSYYDAWAYCHAAGGRLPAAAEFEAIASGAEQRLYPWGNQFDASAWPSGDPSLNIAAQCGLHDSTDTPQGIHELGSSLLEWTTDELGRPMLMGGNAWHRPRRLHALNFIRRSAAADFRSSYTGFRCVYDRPLPPGTTEQPLPWGTGSKVVAVSADTVGLGPPEGSKIVPLLRALKDEKIGVLKHLPLVPASLDLQVMKHEVSRALYARFLRDPLVQLGFFDHPKQPTHIAHEPDGWPQQLEQPDYPVTHVSWWSAWAFARWAGGALPTAEEWQILAGAGLQRFPYGNDYVAGLAVDRNFVHSEEEDGQGGELQDDLQNEQGGDSELQGASQNDSQNDLQNEQQASAQQESDGEETSQPKQRATRVTASKDTSAHGIIGFGGNVAEWTSTSVLRGNAFNLVIKGGSYLMPADGSQVVQTSEAVPDYRSPDLGFRLVFPTK